ncbi:ChrR family anti-sigma-E factor [bacterium]|nr:ChrR family anti-sigma-E factor [bacterium]
MTTKLNYHPDHAMLVEFAAGTLDTATSICVSAHLHFCEQCRAELLSLNEVGAQLMAEGTPEPVDDSVLDSVMAAIDQDQPAKVPKAEQSISSNFPFPVSKLISDSATTLTWKRLTASVDIARLKTGQKDYEVALHKICAGGKTPKHDHNGLEYTVVLKGSFSDERAVYREGDFLLRQPGDVHQPMGAQNGECICLSALAAPINLSNPLGFLMKPWLRINPM